MAESFLATLEETLRKVTAPDNEAIKAASEILQKQYYNNPQTIPALIHILQTNPEVQLRQLAGVEARKLVIKYWDEENSLSVDVRNNIKQSLLKSTLAEQNPLVRHTSSRVVSTIGSVELEKGQWPEFLPLLFTTSKSSVALEREVAVYLLYTLLETETDVLMEHTVDLLHLLSTTIHDPDSSQVRISSVLAIGKVAENIEPSSVKRGSTLPQQNPIELFRTLLPAMVEILKQVISSDDEKSALQVFEVFNTLLLIEPALISKHIGDLISFMLNNVAMEEQLSNEYRLPALQFLITAVRFKKLKIQSLKLGPVLVNGALIIASKPLDDDDDDEDEDDTPAKLALRLIDYLSSSLPPSQVLAPLLSQLPGMIASQDIYQRRAGFLALGAAVEGAPDFVATQISIVLPAIINGLNDTSMLVKDSALQALAHLATELNSVVSDEHETLLPLIFNIMENATTLRIGKSACAALDAILETMDRQEITEKYLSTLVPKLLFLLSATQDAVLKGSIVAAIASASFSAGKNFMPYFEHTISALEPFVRISGDIEGLPEPELNLCAVTLDALSALAGAVGKDAFRPYVEVLINASLTGMKTGNTRLKECGFVLVGVLAKVYGTEFSPFLAPVVSELFECLEQDEFQGVGGDSENDEDDDIAVGQDENDDDILKNFSVNSAIAIEKEVATEALGQIISATKKDFAPFVEKAVELLKEMSEHFYDGIRKHGLNSLWKVYLTWYELADRPAWQPGFSSNPQLPHDIQVLRDTVTSVTLELLAMEDERSVATVACDNFAEALKLSGPQVLASQEDINSLCAEIMLILEKQHRSQVQDEFDDDYDKNEETFEGENGHAAGESSEYDEVLTESALDVVVQLACTLQQEFITVLDMFLPIIFKYCNSSSPTERASGIGALAEVVNGMRSYITKWTEPILQVFLKRLSDSDLEVRSNSAYGIGLLCLYSENNDVIRGSYINILQNLQRLLKKVDKKQRKSSLGRVTGEDDNNARSLSNACGCVARMVLKNPSIVPLSEVVPVLISRLPLTDGLEENTPIFELIIELFKVGNATIAGLQPQILQTFSKVFIQQSEKEHQKANASINASLIILPFENDEIKLKVVELLRFLEHGQPGSVSSDQVLAQVIS